MRTSKDFQYRAWDGKQMHYGVKPWQWDFVIEMSWHRCEKSTGNGILGCGGDTAEMLVPAIRYKNLMEFTGLKDKNGKDIYEGDIIQSAETKLLYVVVYEKGIFRGEQKPKTMAWMHPHDFHNHEIIGNIYENPELLTPQVA